MAASLTLSVAAGYDSSAAVGGSLQYWVTVTNTGANPATLNSLSVSCGNPSLTIAQPDFLTPNVAPGAGNPIIAAGGTFSARFSVSYFAPNMSGPSPQSPTGATNAVNQPAFPVGGFFPLAVQAQITDSAGSIAVGNCGFGVGVLSEAQNVPRAEGGGLDFRQGSNILGFFPGWP
jgi:hypothetical protein